MSYHFKVAEYRKARSMRFFTVRYRGGGQVAAIMARSSLEAGSEFLRIHASETMTDIQEGAPAI